MTATFVVANGNTTIKFEYVKPTAKTQAIITAAAHYLWSVAHAGMRPEDITDPFASLSNQQKLNLVDAHLKQVIMDCAKAYSVTTASDAARDAAVMDADMNLNL